ncbi:MAG: hypothetical protein OXF25_11185 [Cyanobacteria bacterium MAG CAR3_bin_5]|nr:hypothetical protein [Cyanobacteria bacterium MAG CAR3_bin_5]
MSSGGQYGYVRLVFNPLLGLLKAMGVLLIQLLRFIGHALKSVGQILIFLKKLVVDPLFRSPRFIITFTTQLLIFKPNHITPGRYALETVGKWPSRFMKFFPAVFQFFVRWGEERPRFLNRITLLAPVSASLSLLSLAILKASFLGSFLELHFPENLSIEVVKLPVF